MVREVTGKLYQGLAEYLTASLRSVSPNGREVLKFLLLHEEEVSRKRIMIGGLAIDEISNAIRECRDIGITQVQDRAAKRLVV